MSGLAVTVDTHARFSAAWESLFRATRRLRARAQLFAGEADMSLAQYHLLSPLRDTTELAVGELAEAAGVAPPTATRMLDGLARDGYITRRHSETDRRSVLVGLTSDGERAVAKAHGIVESWRRDVFESLEPEEREQTVAALERLTQVLEEQL